jgi:hypothetical protein
MNAHEWSLIMTPQDFFANHTMWGGTSTGNFIIDFMFRPIFRLGLRCPIALVASISLFYAAIVYSAMRSAFFSKHDEGYGFFND